MSGEKAALVVGASGTIGRAISELLVERRKFERLYLTTNTRPLPDLEFANHDELYAFNGFDIANAAQRQKLFNKILQDNVRLKAVILTVGPFLSAPLRKTTIQDLLYLYKYNALYPIEFLREAEQVLDKGAKVIVFADKGVQDLGPRKSTAGYAAAKAAFVVLARSLAAEWKTQGLHLWIIAPAPITNPPRGRSAQLSARVVAEFVADLLDKDASVLSGSILEIP